MSYTNYINKLSSETKKALEESSNVNHEIQDLKKYKYSIKHLNENSIGYTIKYKIIIYDINKREILYIIFSSYKFFAGNFNILLD